MWDGFPLHFKNEQAREQERQNQQWLCQNPPSNLGIKAEIGWLWSIPDHQQGIR